MKFIPLTDPSQIPDAMTEDEARTFWDTHEMTEEYLARVQVSDDDDPSVRERRAVQSRTISIRFENNTAERLKHLAAKKGTAYQTLLKLFVLERLYEEEKRDGMLK